MASLMRLMRPISRTAFVAVPRLATPATGFAMCAARRVAMPSPGFAMCARAFCSQVSPIVISQADSTLSLIAKAEKNILATNEHHKWADLDADLLDEIVEQVGTCRDYCNSLTEEETAAAEAHNGVVSQTDFVEGMLKTAIQCDQLSHRAHELRMEIEDLGTDGEGNNHPGAFTKKWETEVDSLFNQYADMLETCDTAYVQRLENELGYELLLLKRVIHIDDFRAKYPRVHPSGFSASSD